MIEESTKKRSQDWVEELPAENSRQRTRMSAPAGGRSLPGATQSLEDDADEARARIRRSAARRWGWPQSRWLQAVLSFFALILLSATLLGGFWLKSHLYRDARFRIEGIRSIESGGLTEVSRADLLPVFGEDVGRNIFFVPLSERRRQLEQIPWIEHATVMRLLPNRIRIAVIERKPVAFVIQGGKVELADGDGVLMPMPAEALAQHRYSFPVVKGINASDLAPVRSGRMTIYRKLIAELDSDGRRYSEQISEVDLSNPENVRIVPDKNSEIVADFGGENFLERFECYRKYIAGWRQLYPTLSAVDLRYKDRVYLRTTQEGPQEARLIENVPGALQPPAAPVTASATPAPSAKAATLPTPKSPAAPANKPAAVTAAAPQAKPLRSVPAPAGKPVNPAKSSTRPAKSTIKSAATAPASTSAATHDTLVKAPNKPPVAENRSAKATAPPASAPQKTRTTAASASKKPAPAPKTKSAQKAGKTPPPAAQPHAPAKHTDAAPAKPRSNPAPAWWQEQ